jgi:hypothetical protein
MPENPIPAWLSTQYARAKRNGWLPFYRDAAAKFNFTTEDLLGKDSRESNLNNIKGDYHDGVYHGFGLPQLDIGSHRKFIESGQWQDVAKVVMKGAEALAEKRDQIVKASKMKTVTIKFRSGKTVKFTPKPFNDDELRQMTLAAYNCGLASYYHFSLGHDIDAGTTGKNYSADIIERSKDFADLMARDHFGATANDREVESPKDDHAQLTPRPGEMNQFDFDKVQQKYDQHADLLQSPSAKSVATRAAVKAGVGLGSVWETTSGKVAIILSVLVLTGVLSWVIFKYRYQIGGFLTAFKTWVWK